MHVDVGINVLHFITSKTQSEAISSCTREEEKHIPKISFSKCCPKKKHPTQTYLQNLGHSFKRLVALYHVGIMSGNQTRPKCFDTSQWISSSP